MNCNGLRMRPLIRVWAIALPTLLLATAWQTTARADEPWLLSASLSGSTVLDEPYRDAFGVGAGADVGLYRPLVPWMLVGGRLGGVLLAQDQDVGQPSSEHGIFTMARLAAMLRVRPLAIGGGDKRRSTGLWLEVGAGPGFAENGSRLHAVLEGGVGYGFDAGALTIGPALRYQQVIETEDSFAGRDARIASLGIELTFLDTDPGTRTKRIGTRTERFVPPVATADPDRDGDGILGEYDRCDDQPETFNGINDHDGCPDTAAVELVDNRIVVDERVFFDFDRAVVSAGGRKTLRAIRGLYRSAHWRSIRIEGYADSRGTSAYNLDLGTQRANAVRDTLIELTVPTGVMQPVSFGESAPVVVAAYTEAQHALNRRVEFVVTPATPTAP